MDCFAILDVCCIAMMMIPAFIIVVYFITAGILEDIKNKI